MITSGNWYYAIENFVKKIFKKLIEDENDESDYAEDSSSSSNEPLKPVEIVYARAFGWLKIALMSD